MEDTRFLSTSLAFDLVTRETFLEDNTAASNHGTYQEVTNWIFTLCPFADEAISQFNLEKTFGDLRDLRF